MSFSDHVVRESRIHQRPQLAMDCGGPVSSDRLFGFLSEKIIQFVVAEAVEM